MRQAGLLLAVVLAGCGALTPPRPDGGADAGQGGGSAGGGAPGTGGGGGGQEAAWVEVALQVPSGTTGTVQRLAARPGEVFALVGNQFVLRSAGGRFNEVLVFFQPVLGDLQLSSSGAAAVTVYARLMACTTGCEDGNNYSEVGLPGTPLALCGSPDLLGALTTAMDAGARVLEQTDAGWPNVGAFNLRSPLDCARINDGSFFVAGQGAVAHVEDGGASFEVPDTAPLGRPSAQEPWTRLAFDRAQVFTSSARGAVALRTGGAWQVREALGGEITALAVGGANDAWVIGTGVGLARFDGSNWVPAGAGPPLLTSFDALAVEGAHVYVGGHDAANVARIFRRLR